MKDFRTLLDVRTEVEFVAGHLEGAINIPMDEVPDRLDEIRQLATPIAICCRSGNRSGMVVDYLLPQGIDCFNAGGIFE